MTHSTTIGKLSEAMALAQGEITDARRNQSNSFYNTSYADLSSVRAACQAALAKNKIAVFQSAEIQLTPVGVESAAICIVMVLVTTLLSCGDEWIQSELAIAPGYTDKSGKFCPETDAGAIGTAIVYGRRYSLAAMCGVATEDTDGVNPANQKPPRSTPATTVRSADTAMLRATGVVVSVADKKISATKTKFLVTLRDGEKSIEFQTFSPKLRERAALAKEETWPVVIVYTVNQYGNSIEQILSELEAGQK